MGTGAAKSEQNEIWVIEFNEKAAQEFRSTLLTKAAEDPNQPIVIYIDSYGGSVDGLAKMLETMDEIPNRILTVCMGKAMSAGAILLSHGDIRWCGRHSRIMVHEISSGTFGKIPEMRADMKEFERLNKYFMDLLAKNCGLKSSEDLHKIFHAAGNTDIFMDAEGAVKFGLVDKVGIPKLEHETNWMCSAVLSKTRGISEATEPSTKPVKKTKKKK
jgi:ATP-dependent Clp protease protease subunit